MNTRDSHTTRQPDFDPTPVACLPTSCIRLAPGVFHQRQETNRRHLLALDPDRLLVGFRRQAGIATSAEPYGGWESKDIAGHSLGHVLSALAHLHAATGDARALEQVDKLVAGLAACQEAAGDGYVLPVPRAVFTAISAGRIEVTAFSLNGCWVPFYTLHKVLAGLRDAHRLCASVQALTIAAGIGRWLHALLSPLPDERIQAVLVAEHGGMQEVLLDLADDLDDPQLRALAVRCFHHRETMEPLIARLDRLDGMHGNTIIPKVIGLARRYEIEGATELRAAVEWFWSTVVDQRSYCIGGHGDSEHFFAPQRFADHLTPYTAETCNSYNLLKLTAHLFAWEPRVALIDFAERVLLNHVLANIGREPGEYGYFLGLGAVATKVFSTPCDSWWCCVGTGLESPTRYAELAYAERHGELWVNLYQAGRTVWHRRGVELNQETRFPDGEEVRITITCAHAAQWRMHVRLPGWCQRPRVLVNGVALQDLTAGSYLALDRIWNNGDSIELHLPMDLAIEPLPHAPQLVALRHGPLVLAGVVPTIPGIPDPACERHHDHLCARGKTDDQSPVLAVTPGSDLRSALVPIPGEPGCYRSHDLVQPTELTFRPLLHLYEEHYAVYFPVLTPHDWAQQADALRHAARRGAAEEAALVDQIAPGFQQSEVEHGLVCQHSRSGDFRDRKWRDAASGGSFAYDLAVDPRAPCSLDLTCWGGEWVACGFTLTIADEVVLERRLHHDQPGDFFRITVPLAGLVPAATARVRLAIHPLPGMTSGRIFDLRIRRDSASG